ncbi:hypothetical protein K1T71_008010 [Dendrolimus kikuchii]|uniref:Uncharacterized protein n=1 Tax=Dendrolimus kikuchii TaxID=765133 RepID=A0ACC1CZ11_9NEOP|nr:hypothetical protein K1T71_008010 [Dendrolimus kikuchii]
MLYCALKYLYCCILIFYIFFWFSPPTGSNCESKPSSNPLEHTQKYSFKSVQPFRRSSLSTHVQKNYIYNIIDECLGCLINCRSPLQPGANRLTVSHWAYLTYYEAVQRANTKLHLNSALRLSNLKLRPLRSFITFITVFVISTGSIAPNFVAQRKRKERSNSDEQLSTFKEDIMNMIQNWKDAQNSLLNKLITDLADIKEQNNQIKRSNNEIERSLEFLNLQYEDMKSKIQNLETERKVHLLQINSLEDKLEDMERNLKSSAIEIRSVPIINNPETKNDLYNIVQNICKALNVIVPQTSIRDVYRVNKRAGKGTIIADFTSVLLKNEIIKSLKVYNKEHPTHRLNANSIGIQGNDSQIYLSESLTAKGRRLFFLARDAAKTLGYTFCWSSKGRIFLRKTLDSPHVEIKSESQLVALNNKK